MRKIIRLTESELNNIIKEAVNRILQEDGEIGGGGATNCVGINVGGAAGQAKNHIDAPAFGGKNKKKVGGNAFSEPIMRQAHNLGDVTQAKTNQVDMGETEKRSKDFKNGSMAIQRVESKKKIDDVIDESIGNWLKGAALGGMIAMSSPQAAQAGNYKGVDNWNGRHHKTGQKFDNRSILDKGYGKKDTLYWNDATQVTPQMKQRLNTYYNNAKILFDCQEKSPWWKGHTVGEDFTDWIRSAIDTYNKSGCFSMNENYLGYLTVSEIDGSSEVSLINSIQELGLPDLAPNINYYGIFKGDNGKWYLFGAPGGQRGDYYTHINGLQH